MTRTAALIALGVALAAAGCDETAPVAAAVDLDLEARTPIVPGPDGLGAFLDCLSGEGITLVDAHRGGPAPGYPENAIATMARTVSRAAATLEIDVAATRDNVLILMHDDTLDRTTTCDGDLADADFDELAECRLVDERGAVTDFPIPTLAEALAWGEGRTVLRLDVKQSVAYEDVIDAIREADAENRVAIITYSVGQAARVARLAPDLIVNTDVGSLDELEELEDRGVDRDRIVAWTGTERLLEGLNAALDDRGVPVVYGTLGGSQSVDGEIERSGDEERYLEIADADVDIIATDRPIEAFEALLEERDPALAIRACGE